MTTNNAMEFAVIRLTPEGKHYLNSSVGWVPDAARATRFTDAVASREAGEYNAAYRELDPVSVYDVEKVGP